MTDLDPQTRTALDERIAWINRVTELVFDDDWPAINELDDQHLRGMIYVLVMARGGDAQRMRGLVQCWDAAPQN